MAQYRVRGEGFAETLTADDWRVDVVGNVVFYTRDGKVAYYRSPVSVRGIGTPTGDAHAETKKIAAQRDQFQQRNLDLERVIEGLRTERDDWQAESHRLQAVVDKLCERHTQEDWDAAMTALEGARESRDHWRGMYQSKDRAALGKIRELQQELETAQAMAKTAQATANSWKEGRAHWYEECKQLRLKLENSQQDAEELKEFWQTRYKEAETTIKDLRQELEAREAAVKYLRDGTASLEDLQEAQRERDSWHDKYTELSREVHPALRDKAFWQTRYKEAETTIEDLRQKLNSAQQDRDYWHRQYTLLAAKLREMLDDD